MKRGELKRWGCLLPCPTNAAKRADPKNLPYLTLPYLTQAEPAHGPPHQVERAKPRVKFGLNFSLHPIAVWSSLFSLSPSFLFPFPSLLHLYYLPNSTTSSSLHPSLPLLTLYLCSTLPHLTIALVVYPIYQPPARREASALLHHEHHHYLLLLLLPSSLD